MLDRDSEPDIEFDLLTAEAEFRTEPGGKWPSFSTTLLQLVELLRQVMRPSFGFVFDTGYTKNV